MTKVMKAAKNKIEKLSQSDAAKMLDDIKKAEKKASKLSHEKLWSQF
jgi:hypothetical protein